MERAFGADFSGVRIHDGRDADDLSQRIQAKAFTIGGDIFFARGQYRPASTDGRALLAHELTHTVQQRAEIPNAPRPDGFLAASTQRLMGSRQVVARMAERDQYLDRVPSVQALLAKPASQGPRSVQRLVMTAATLKSHGGEPKEDVSLLITTKHMSTRYKQVIDELGAYHAIIDNQVGLWEKGVKDAPRKQEIVDCLYTLKASCNQYITAHQKAVEGITEKQGKSQQVKPEEEADVKRFRAIEQIVGQADSDISATAKIIPIMNKTWRQLIISYTTSGLDAQALVGDSKLPTPEPGSGDVFSFGKPGVDQARARPGQQSPQQIPVVSKQVGMYDQIVVKATENNPHVTENGRLPNEDALFTATPLENNIFGGPRLTNTIATPASESDLLSDSLYIDDTLNVSDVRQGGIGDCYLLAVVSGIASKDPVQLWGMMQLIGSGKKQFAAEFFRLDPKVDTWVKQRIIVPTSMVMVNGSLKGVRLTRSAGPKYTNWSVKQTQNTVTLPRMVRTGRTRGPQQPEQEQPVVQNEYTIHRHDFYEVALWAPLLEKAYARFAQEYGKYGTPQTDDDFKPQDNRPGFDIISSGGRENQIYGMFYGPKVASHGVENVNYDVNQAPDNNVVNNRAMIEHLAAFKKTNRRDNTESSRTLLTASASPAAHIANARAVINKLLRDDQALHEFDQALRVDIPDDQPAQQPGVQVPQKVKPNRAKLGLRMEFSITALDQFTKALEDASAALNDVAVEEAKPIRPGYWADDKRAVIKRKNVIAGDASKAVVKASSPWSNFLHTTRTTIFVNLVETLSNVMNLGTDFSPGQRNIYSSHAYTILDVKFVGKDGQEIVNFDPKVHLNNLSATASTIVIRNPHAMNAPNPHGETTEPQTEGVFTFTFDQFVRNFGSVDYATLLR